MTVNTQTIAIGESITCPDGEAYYVGQAGLINDGQGYQTGVGIEVDVDGTTYLLGEFISQSTGPKTGHIGVYLPAGHTATLVKSYQGEYGLGGWANVRRVL